MAETDLGFQCCATWETFCNLSELLFHFHAMGDNLGSLYWVVGRVSEKEQARYSARAPAHDICWVNERGLCGLHWEDLSSLAMVLSWHF